MRWMTAMIALSLFVVPGAALAGHGNGNGGGHDTFPGLPDQALFGICTAYENNENGRENGQAGNAPPFQWLNETADDADQTVEEFCAENGQHPGQGSAPEPPQGPPEDPGPP